MECADQKRCEELAKSSSFYRRIYSEVEEIGWEHLVRFGEDLRLLSFHTKDKKGRVHILQITLDGSYPNHPPSIAADVPYLFNLKWSINSRLKDAIQQFHKHLEKLQDFWNLMDDIDHSLLVSDLRYPQRALSHRQLNISNDSYIILSIDANDPTSLPDCRFLGSDSGVERLRAMWRKNCKRWKKDLTIGRWRVAGCKSYSVFSSMIGVLNIYQEKGFRDCGLVGKDGFKFLFRKVEEVLLAIMSLGDLSLKMTESFLRMRDKPFSENLAHVLDIQLHGPSSIQKTDAQTECGICYAQYLPIDDELGDKSGSGTDCTCENNSCSRAFHSVCLGDWLRSITTTRQSFDVLFGNCPYCSDPIAVKMNTRK
ncbi:hypothetical protein MTR67_011644 [Solanum verrucosum]|uniref:E3 ubiquitin-protein ligase FANCL n=1 Tax=Solanum verrucosum TaxID=315347 RepID=A0AAF0QE63_SOLVR|nr:hypothetical protein MTR67_011644 [Solanum verrucosum]